MAETISACLIVRDEEERLPAALASVAFCDQIVVVDSGSTDRTREIAQEAGALVVENPWPGFSAQRNVAIDHATSDWVLEIDADETLTPELQEEMQRFLASPPPGYDICGLPQFHRFLGAELRPSMKYPAYRTRMFRRGAYRHDESRAVHEGLWPSGPVWPFEHDMSHELAGSWGEALRDARNYARLEASLLPPSQSAAATLKGTVVRPAGKFWFRLIVDGGWRDGLRGIARIGLDCLSDSMVWLRRSKGEVGEGSDDAGHFAGARPEGWGTPLVIGVASGAAAASRAESWAAQAREAGIDVSLITTAPPQNGAVRVRRIRRFGPLHLARALEAERQLRGQADALLVEGRVARALMRVMPASLKGRRPPVDTGEDAAAAKSRLSKTS
ncbi:MAG TPA: glycosyltransferase family 2 protein [Thermoleophilaceae bacterium]